MVNVCQQLNLFPKTKVLELSMHDESLSLLLVEGAVYQVIEFFFLEFKRIRREYL